MTTEGADACKGNRGIGRPVVGECTFPNDRLELPSRTVISCAQAMRSAFLYRAYFFIAGCSKQEQQQQARAELFWALYTSLIHFSPGARPD